MPRCDEYSLNAYGLREVISEGENFLHFLYFCGTYKISVGPIITFRGT